MKYFLFAVLVVVLLVVLVAGPRGRHSPGRPFEFFPDMVRQSKVKPQSPSGFFADGGGPRRPVEGTVPIGFDAPAPGGTTATSQIADELGAKRLDVLPRLTFSDAPDYYSTGMIGDQWGSGIPVEVTPALLAKGRERFTINCQVCHGATGAGNGVTSKYGLANIANYHLDKYLKMADGDIFYTTSNGPNSMNGYGSNLSLRDRWAIVCYVRALQRAQNVRIGELPPDEQAALANAKP